MKVGDDIEVKRASWTFGGEVADTFVDHAAKSIPLYHEGHELVCGLSDYFVQPDGYCYELGTSTGQLIRKLAEHNSHKEGTTWVGLDREETMIEKAREHCAGLPNVELYAEDFFLHDMQKADFIVSYYVLQFVPPRLRQDAFDRIYERLNWGGALVLFEKVRGPDARFQDIANNMYTNFKRQNGLSPDEILNKTDSLKSVMEPFSTQGNIDLMNRAGFVDIMPVSKWVCFEGFLAIK